MVPPDTDPRPDARHAAPPWLRVDAQAPWLAAWRGPVQALLPRCRTAGSVHAALNTPNAPRRFVAQHERPRDEPYESFIARTGCVPTRDNLHDLFNGLVWHAEPALKARLNALQAAAIARDGIGPVRGALRDALTQFDENGALFDGPVPLLDALRRRDWPALFIHQRGLWRHVRLRIVGHALLEQLTTAPRKPLTAHVFDGDALAADVARWSAKPFLPLPVLGVPGWWPANQQPSFYDDAVVFRPAKSPFAARASA